MTSKCTTCCAAADKNAKEKRLEPSDVTKEQLHCMSNDELAKVNDSATNHAWAHADMSKDAFAANNVDLASNENWASKEGAQLAWKTSGELDARAVADPGNAALQAQAATAKINATDATGFWRGSLQPEFSASVPANLGRPDYVPAGGGEPYPGFRTRLSR